MSKAIKISLLFILANILLISADSWRECTIDPTKDLNDTQVLYLHPNLTEFVYPTAPDSLPFKGDGPLLKVACPGGTIAVRDNVTTLKSVLVECVGGKAVQITGSYIYGPLSHIGCTGSAEPIAQLTGRKAPNGKNIAEIGYSLGMLEFVSVIEEVVVSRHNGAYIARWAKYKLPTVPGSPSAKRAPLRNGNLSGKLAYTQVYNKAQQRSLLKAKLLDEAVVEKYMPANGTEAFVAGQLVNAEDVYYEVQQNVTTLYELTVPIWSSVNSGNWKLVGDVVRQMAKQNLADITVWSGSYLSLYLPNSAGKNVYIDLSEKIRPGQFLFKYVYNSSNKQGLVFVTVNNPHLTEATKSNVICEKLASCQAEYPDFAKFEKGYTYCCSLQSFKKHAQNLGLPTFDSLELL